MTLQQAMTELMSKVEVTDLRVQGRVKYPLLPLLFSVIMAWCGGFNNAVLASDFIHMHKARLAELIPNFGNCGEVSHDTILRLLKMLRFSELNSFLYEFCQALLLHRGELPNDQLRVLSMDGQTPRSIVYEPEEGRKSPQDPEPAIISTA